LSTGDIATNLATMVASRSSSRLTRGLDHNSPRKSKIILGRGLRTWVVNTRRFVAMISLLLLKRTSH
jgi:hypothetical protein